MTLAEARSLVAMAAQAKISGSKLNVTAGDLAELRRFNLDTSNMVIGDHPKPREGGAYDPHASLRTLRD